MLIPPQSTGMIVSCFEAMNKRRKDAGVPPLAMNACLTQQADSHADRMAYELRLSHDGFYGRLVACDKLTGAENVAQGYDSGDAVVAGWMASQPHRENILNPAWKNVGVGYQRLGKRSWWWGRQDHWWCAIFSI